MIKGPLTLQHTLHRLLTLNRAVFLSINRGRGGVSVAGLAGWLAILHGPLPSPLLLIWPSLQRTADAARDRVHRYRVKMFVLFLFFLLLVLHEYESLSSATVVVDRTGQYYVKYKERKVKDMEK